MNFGWTREGASGSGEIGSEINRRGGIKFGGAGRAKCRRRVQRAKSRPVRWQQIAARI